MKSTLKIYSIGFFLALSFFVTPYVARAGAVADVVSSVVSTVVDAVVTAVDVAISITPVDIITDGAVSDFVVDTIDYAIDTASDISTGVYEFVADTATNVASTVVDAVGVAANTIINTTVAIAEMAVAQPIIFIGEITNWEFAKQVGYSLQDDATCRTLNKPISDDPLATKNCGNSFSSGNIVDPLDPLTSTSSPVITSFSASPNRVFYGNSTKLFWTSKNTISCILFDGDKELASDLSTNSNYSTLPLTEDRTFQIFCSGILTQTNFETLTFNPASSGYTIVDKYQYYNSNTSSYLTSSDSDIEGGLGSWETNAGIDLRKLNEASRYFGPGHNVNLKKWTGLLPNTYYTFSSYIKSNGLYGEVIVGGISYVPTNTWTRVISEGKSDNDGNLLIGFAIRNKPADVLITQVEMGISTLVTVEYKPLKVEVVDPIYASINAEPLVIKKGQYSKVSWSAEDVSSCILTRDGKKISDNECPSSTKINTTTCRKLSTMPSCGENEKAVSGGTAPDGCPVPPKCVPASCTSYTSTCSANERVTFSGLDSTGCPLPFKCEALSCDLSGSQNITIDKPTTEFVIDCKNRNNSVFASTSVTLYPKGMCKISNAGACKEGQLFWVGISADPESVDLDSSSMISWEAPDADSCSLYKNGDSFNTSSTATSGAISSGKLTSKTSFTVKCQKDSEELDVSIAVSINGQNEGDSDDLEENIFGINLKCDASQENSTDLYVNRNTLWTVSAENKPDDVSLTKRTWTDETGEIISTTKLGEFSKTYTTVGIKTMNIVDQYFDGKYISTSKCSKSIKVKLDPGTNVNI